MLEIRVVAIRTTRDIEIWLNAAIKVDLPTPKLQNK
jgi:hypothetical protein